MSFNVFFRSVTEKFFGLAVATHFELARAMCVSCSKQFRLDITNEAVQRLKSVLKPGQYLRVSVSSGGCSGLRYCFEVDSLTDANDIMVNGPDGHPHVVVDNISSGYVNGSTLTYKEQLIKSSFVIVDNPNAKLGCGCGTSFDPVDT